MTLIEIQKLLDQTFLVAENVWPPVVDDEAASAKHVNDDSTNYGIIAVAKKVRSTKHYTIFVVSVNVLFLVSNRYSHVISCISHKQDVTPVLQCFLVLAIPRPHMYVSGHVLQFQHLDSRGTHKTTF